MLTICGFGVDLHWVGWGYVDDVQFKAVLGIWSRPFVDSLIVGLRMLRAHKPGPARRSVNQE